ncbi:hypothetical protein AAZX31_09G130300 [Glycine max]
MFFHEEHHFRLLLPPATTTKTSSSRAVARCQHSHFLNLSLHFTSSVFLFSLSIMAARFQSASGMMKFKSMKGWKSIVPLHLKGKSATRFSLFRKVNLAGDLNFNPCVI